MLTEREKRENLDEFFIKISKFNNIERTFLKIVSAKRIYIECVLYRKADGGPNGLMDNNSNNNLKKKEKIQTYIYTHKC